MARSTLNVQFDLTHIKCHDEGDGWGSAEPYLWTVFFLVDGSTISVNSGLTLSGNATMHFTPGSHGNLPNDDVDAGETVTIPAAIGEWQTLMKPIPVPPPFDAVQPDVGGVVGVVCVLMEEDNVSDSGAAAGHTALNNAVRTAVNQIVATRTLTNQEVTEGELAQFETTIQNAVSNAVQNEQNFFENLWSWINPDDTIGFQVFLFKHDDLASKGTIAFSRRWKNEGDWEIFGNVTATVTCPANALDNLLSRRSAPAPASTWTGCGRSATVASAPFRAWRSGGASPNATFPRRSASSARTSSCAAVPRNSPRSPRTSSSVRTPASRPTS